MMCRSVFITAFSVWSFLQAEDPPPPLTVEQAVSLALEHNRGLLNAASDVEEARWELAAREADFEFRAGFRARAGRDDLADRFEGGMELQRRFSTGGDARVFGGAATTGDDSETFVRVNARQPLFRRAGRLATLEPLTRAERGLTDARRAHILRAQDLTLEVIVSHESVLRAARQVESDASALERLQGLTRLTRVREDLGQASRVDTLRIELQLGEASTRLDNSRDMLTEVAEAFANLLGLSPNQRFSLQPAPLLEIEIPDPDEATAIALRNRLDVAMALDALDDASRIIRVTRRELLPDIGLLGDVDLRGEGRDVERDRWFVGFVVEPDFNPTQRRARVETAESRRDRAERQLVELHYRVGMDVRRQIRAHHRAHASLRVAARNREIAFKRLELAEALFRMGRGDSFTLSEAENDHTQAVNAELAARTEASLSAHRLLASMGKLVEAPADLKIPFE